MKTYHLKVTIMGLPKTYRVIEATENCTFSDLHVKIFSAYDRYEEHLYSFFITKKHTDSMRKIYDSPEITHPMGTKDIFSLGDDEKKDSAAEKRLRDVDLKEKDVFYYLFDFGDSWWHKIVVEAITETTGKRKSIKIVKSVGESPPQYPDVEDEEYEDEEDEEDEEDDTEEDADMSDDKNNLGDEEMDDDDENEAGRKDIRT